MSLTNRRTGRMVYVPNPFFQKIEEIKTTNNVDRSKAFDKILNYARIGEELERFNQLFYGAAMRVRPKKRREDGS